MKMAVSTLMAATFVALGFGVIAGGSLAVPGADGKAEEVPVWENAATDIAATAAREHRNLSFMGFAVTPSVQRLILNFGFASDPSELPTLPTSESLWASTDPLLALPTLDGKLREAIGHSGVDNPL